jgi:secondary thiamine-phosphate synthase enzyme
MIQQETLKLPSYDRGIHLITDKVREALPELPDQGLLNIFVRHTSAGIMINENNAPEVRKDFKEILQRLIPDDEPYYTHTEEGPDDMPSHVKSAFVGHSVNVPITDGDFDFGTWQGIYLCEFRINKGGRTLKLTLYQ